MFAQSADNAMRAVAHRSVPVTRQISAENPTGARGAGAMAAPDSFDPDRRQSGPAAELGRGFKVRPFVRVGAHDAVTLADIHGAGLITHFYITSNIPDLRELWLLVYRVSRLVERHKQFGRSSADAETWVSQSDEANTALIAADISAADLIVSNPARPRGRPEVSAVSQRTEA